MSIWLDNGDNIPILNSLIAPIIGTIVLLGLPSLLWYTTILGSLLLMYCTV